MTERATPMAVRNAKGHLTVTHEDGRSYTHKGKAAARAEAVIFAAFEEGGPAFGCWLRGDAIKAEREAYNKMHPARRRKPSHAAVHSRAFIVLVTEEDDA